MSINSQDLFDAKASKYGGASSTRFQSAYVRSVNTVLKELETEGLLDSITKITGVDGTIDIDEKWEPTVDVGVDFYLQQSGQWSVDDKRDYQQEYMYKLGRVQAQYFIDYEDNSAHGKLGDLS